MTIATSDRRVAAAAHAETDSYEHARVLGHSARCGSVSFERPAPGRYLALGEGELTRLIPLRGAVTHVGRGFSADLRLEDQSVSRRHAIIVDRRTEARLLDDRSANGTFVNGWRVAEATLRDRDVIRLGRVTLVYVEIAGTRPEPG
jgi:pSer/pThr/pTyr-binding forkhead associated (FHA) protein